MAVNIFFCYAHEDELYLNKLKAYLRPLQRQGLIDVWHDRDINAGMEWEREISQRLNEAKIILLLVSPDFMNSDYCYSVEMKRALERHDRQEAIVIPIILRPIYWQSLLGKLQALPTDAKPVVDRSWHTLDEALYDVAEGIRKIVVQVSPKPFFPSQKLEALSLLRTLTGHRGNVSSVAFSPDGQILASGGSHDQTIKLWDVASGQEVQTLTGHTSWVHSVAFSPDGQILASGGNEDHTIKLWDVATGKEVRTLTCHKGWVHSVAFFSPDGQILASGGSHDQTIKLWDVATGKEVRTLTVYTGWVESVAFSPDGQTLASRSGDYFDHTFKLWNVATGEKVRTLTGHKGNVNSMAFSPDGQTLASGSGDGKVKQVSPDGQILASGGGDDTIKLWDVATGKEVRTLTCHKGWVHSVAFSPDGQTLVSGGRDGTIKLWDVATGKEVQTLKGHTDDVLSVAFSPDGQTLASGSQDGTIKIWGKK